MIHQSIGKYQIKTLPITRLIYKPFRWNDANSQTLLRKTALPSAAADLDQKVRPSCTIPRTFTKSQLPPCSVFRHLT